MKTTDSIGLIATMTEIPAEKRLVAAVIQQAIRDAKRSIRAKREEEVRSQLRERMDAIDWLEASGADWLALIMPSGKDAGELHQRLMYDICKTTAERHRRNLDSGFRYLQRDDPTLVAWNGRLDVLRIVA